MIKIVKGDITTLAVDAIVNAAKIAMREVEEFLAAKGAEMEVVFCCCSDFDRNVYTQLAR